MIKKRERILVCSVLFAVLFLAALAFIKLGLFNTIDISVNQYFKEIQSRSVFQLMSLITLFGSTLFAAIFSVFVLGFFYYKKDIKNGVLYIFSVLFGWVLGYVIKILVQRVRPVNLLEADYSFPSGHVLVSGLLCLFFSYALWESHRKTAVALLSFPILMAITRLYLGVHWFSDILGSLFFALLWFFISILLFDITKKYLPH